MTVTVRVHGIVGAQHTRERPTHGWLLEDVADLWHTREDIVSRIALIVEDLEGAIVDLLMEGRRQGRTQDDIAIHDEVAHLVVRE